jgi:hypothetical protein
MNSQSNYSEALNQLVDAQLLSLFTLGRGSEALLRRLVEKNLKNQPDDFLISVSAEFELVKRHTLLIDPARFIRESSSIFHARILEELFHPLG